MKKRAVALCGVAAMAAGMIVTVPSAAGSGAAAAATGRADSIGWKECGTKNYPTLQCASVKVPLDHTRPQGRKITLALSKVPHTADTSQGPLLVNPGGPGGSGLSLAGFVATSLPKKVASQYDVIGFDPRGVGKSEPALDCKPGHFDPVRPDTVPASSAAEDANIQRAKSFAQACGKKYGDLLPYIDTVSAARDLDVIRRALGAQRINYFGYSYGTYLGAVYAKLYPERVRRLVLDSVVDPTGVWYEDNLSQDYAFDDRHKAFAAWVAKHDTTYHLGTDPARVEASWYAMRKAVAQRPAGGTVGASELEDTFLPGGYFNGYWPDLAAAFSSYVNEDDPAPLVAAHKSLGAVDASGDNGYSVYTAVQCRDADWPRDWNQWRADSWKVHGKAPFMTWNNTWYNAPCAFWPTRTLTPPDVANSELPPVLLFQATGDAATPYEGGTTMHRKLEGSSLVVEEGGGNHGITLSGNACLDGHLADYLETGRVPRGGEGPADAVCDALPEPKPATEKAAKNTKSTEGTQGTDTASKGAALHRLLGFRG